MAPGHHHQPSHQRLGVNGDAAEPQAATKNPRPTAASTPQAPAAPFPRLVRSRPHGERQPARSAATGSSAAASRRASRHAASAIRCRADVHELDEANGVARPTEAAAMSRSSPLEEPRFTTTLTFDREALRRRRLRSLASTRATRKSTSFIARTLVVERVEADGDSPTVRRLRAPAPSVRAARRSSSA